MEDRYYTPDIKEFYVGFECETRIEGRTLWEKTIFENLGELDAVYDYDCRVKYLDKEDIESLGFEYKGDRTYHRRNNRDISGFSKNLVDGSFCHITCFMNEDGVLDSTWLSIEITDIFENEDSSPFGGYREGGSDGFVGTIWIKNKSELKKLLEWLKII